MRPPVQRAPQNPNVFKHTMPDMSRYYSKKAPVVSNKLGEMIKKAQNTQMIDALIDREKKYKYPMYSNPVPGMLPPQPVPTQSVIYQNPNTNQRNSTVARRDSMPPLMRSDSVSSRGSRPMSGIENYEPEEYFYPALDIDDPFDDSNEMTPVIQEPEDPFTDANETRLIDQPVYYPEIDEGLVIEQGPAPTGRSPISSPIITYPESPVIAAGRMNSNNLRMKRIAPVRKREQPENRLAHIKQMSAVKTKLKAIPLGKAGVLPKGQPAVFKEQGPSTKPLALTAGPHTEDRVEPKKPASIRKEKRASGYMYRDAKKQKTK